jgi:demethylmenaquinone methyltransferase/2-methoxy-6-polyprenyl-1,4-benzoquinol methylase
MSVNYESGRLAPDAVRRMFDRIAPFYDAMNHTMTAGLDRRWRRLAAEAVVRPGDVVLDACCGTGDLAVAAARAGGRVTGLDFSEPMLERARRKAPELEWIRGDLLELPFADASFDSATVGFGVRNVDDLQGALAELRRVLGPRGRLGILEITRPRGPLAPFYRLWFDGVVPLLGKLLPGGSAYTYLPASVRRFPAPAELATMIEAAGFRDVRVRLFAGGIVALHIADAKCARSRRFGTRRASTTISPTWRSDSGRRSARIEASSPKWALKPSRRAASGCGPCSCICPRRPAPSRRWPPESPSSSCTWPP